MCGIAALIEPGRLFDDRLLAAIDRDLFHRGPDSGGRLVEPGWAMVFRRLSIMDPSAASDQPMTDADGMVSLVFNGEIYNFRALRAELEGAGVRFRTQGDTEVILEGYRHWGEAVLDRLEGMFALVLLDRRAGYVFAARDPLGIKPLYFTQSGRTIAFASEVRPLTRIVNAEVDTTALGELLSFGWAAGSLSNYRAIERLTGGTCVRVDLADGRVARRRFCDPLDTLQPDGSTGEEDAQEAVRRSVEAHLMSDVGYGLQLSGGVDSSLVAALAAAQARRKLDSYSVHVDDPSLDEGVYRAPVIERFGLNHKECPLDGRLFADALPKAVAAMEGPVPHGGCVGLYRLCETIAKDHKVVLTGEGADEMFGGYLRYQIWRKLLWQERLDRLWPPAIPMPARWPFKGAFRLRGRDFAAYASLYEDLRAMSDLFPELVPPPCGARELASHRFDDFRDRLFAVDQTAYLESLLVRQDKMSMAHSVEARVPFVHMPLQRVVNKLPRDVRTPGGETKPVLKRLADRHLPHDLVHRRKAGLPLSYSRWAQDEQGLGRYFDLLSDPNGCLRAYTDGKRLDAVVAALRAGRRADMPRPFALMNVELWLRSVSAQAD